MSFLPLVLLRAVEPMSESLRLTYACPGACGTTNRQEIGPATTQLECPRCGWNRPVEGAAVLKEKIPSQCLVCGCADLWRQKDFPQKLGLAMVAGGGLLSTIAWFYYRPVLALGILMAFALVDLLLYAFMGDTLVCYRCGSRHRPDDLDDSHPAFDLELAERYRQEAIRLEEVAARK